MKRILAWVVALMLACAMFTGVMAEEATTTIEFFCVKSEVQGIIVAAQIN